MKSAWRTTGTVIALVGVLALAVRIGAIDASVAVAGVGAVVILSLWRVFRPRSTVVPRPADGDRR